MDLKRYFRGPLFWIVLADPRRWSSSSCYVVVPAAATRRSTPRGDRAGHPERQGRLRQDHRPATSGSRSSSRTASKIDGASRSDGQGTRRSRRQLQTQGRGRPADELRRSGSQAERLRRACCSASCRSSLIVLFFFFLMNQMQGGGSRVMNFGKSKAKLITQGHPEDHVRRRGRVPTRPIEELQEIKEFLQNPAKFQAIGAKIPKGVLLYGPPGHRQDAARPRGRRRGRRAVLLDLRLGLRRDVRRCRRLPRA